MLSNTSLSIRPHGILLHGPSGCGKTALLKQLKQTSKFPIISIAGYELISKFMGEAELKINEVFTTAKEIAPSIIVFDDIHIYANSADDLPKRIAAAIGTQMDALSECAKKGKSVVVIAATAKPEEVESQLRRGGRLDYEIRIEGLSEQERKGILEELFGSMKIEVDIAGT